LEATWMKDADEQYQAKSFFPKFLGKQDPYVVI
jgi:hypothetical protein